MILKHLGSISLLYPLLDHLGVCNDLKRTQSTLILHFPYNYNFNGVDIMHKTFINGCLKKVSNGVVETIFETFFFLTDATLSFSQIPVTGR